MAWRKFRNLLDTNIHKNMLVGARDSILAMNISGHHRKPGDLLCRLPGLRPWQHHLTGGSSDSEYMVGLACLLKIETKQAADLSSSLMKQPWAQGHQRHHTTCTTLIPTSTTSKHRSLDCICPPVQRLSAQRGAIPHESSPRADAIAKPPDKGKTA
ncbi:hypothetical protein SKAU_G00165700 [Synaphobranchus kaupii]|uniref:Uncharacterized protein n=1 Tax=Synaphobranchus kaupii TaxID=118154 RepID=A0A9Q1J075_SYNKA|nr:hypothetical protein SKAU_G00165700 [Synaphobranchus kaupii]